MNCFYQSTVPNCHSSYKTSTKILMLRVNGSIENISGWEKMTKYQNMERTVVKCDTYKNIQQFNDFVESTHFCLDGDSSRSFSSCSILPHIVGSTPDVSSSPHNSGSTPTRSSSSLLMSSCRAATFSLCFLDFSWFTNLWHKKIMFPEILAHNHILPWLIKLNPFFFIIEVMKIVHLNLYWN